MHNIEDIKQKAQVYLTPSRYEHSIRVYNTALDIVEKKKRNSTLSDSFSIEKMKLVALLHDLAKKFNPHTIQEIGIKNTDTQSELFLKYPKIWHAFIGPLVIKKIFKITDPEIGNAIRNHTTGNKKMSDLCKLVFIADYIEPGRKAAVSDWISDLAVNRLDDAVYVISALTVQYLNKNNTKIHQNTLECYSYYKDKLDFKKKDSLDKKIKEYNLFA